MAVLIVDDEPDIRHILTLFLTLNGYATVGVANGAEALEHLQHSPELPEAILLDMMMPLMSGVEFRQIQQQDARLAAIPVIIMSAATDLAEQGRLLQAAGWLSKPIDLEGLLRLVGQLCQRSQERGI